MIVPMWTWSASILVPCTQAPIYSWQMVWQFGDDGGAATAATAAQLLVTGVDGAVLISGGSGERQ